MIAEILAGMNLSKGNAYRTGGATSKPLLAEALDPALWQNLSNHEFGQLRLAELTGALPAFVRTDPPLLRFADLMRFYRTGSRSEYEALYFERRFRFEVLALSLLAWPALSDTAGKKDVTRSQVVEALENLMWAICEEYSWCLPAHMRIPAEAYKAGAGRDSPADKRGMGEAGVPGQRPDVDLFACETAFALAEILDLAGAEFSPEVIHRVRQEADRRVIDAYLNYEGTFSWEGARHNWAAVCAGSIGAAALYLPGSPNRLNRLLARLSPSLDSYLDGFAPDGACAEGMNYWTYGFGHFVAFADLLKRFTGGRIDLLGHPALADRVGAISAFPGRVQLNGGAMVCFSDSVPPFRYPAGLCSYLSHHVPEIAPLDWRYAEAFDQKVHRRWSQHLRDFIWFDTKPQSAGNTQGLSPVRSHYFADTQWLTVSAGRGEDGMSFAAKAGHNDEPHNHNDVGSFMILRGAVPLLDDFGAGNYDRDYFGPRRYDSFVASSLSHSVPIVNGAGQVSGAAARAVSVSCRRKTAANGGGKDAYEFAFDMAPAYGIPALSALVRSFSVNAEGDRIGVVLTDAYRLALKGTAGATDDAEGLFASGMEIRERFVTLEPVNIRNANEVVVGNGGDAGLLISADREPSRIEYSERTFAAFGAVRKHAGLIDFVYSVEPAALQSPDFTLGFRIAFRS